MFSREWIFKSFLFFFFFSKGADVAKGLVFLLNVIFLKTGFAYEAAVGGVIFNRRGIKEAAGTLRLSTSELRAVFRKRRHLC